MRHSGNLELYLFLLVLPCFGHGHLQLGVCELSAPHPQQLYPGSDPDLCLNLLQPPSRQVSGNKFKQALLSMGSSNLLVLKHNLNLPYLEDAVDSALVERSKSKMSLEDREGSGSNPDTRAIVEGPRQPSTGSSEISQDPGARDAAVSIHVDPMLWVSVGRLKPVQNWGSDDGV